MACHRKEVFQKVSLTYSYIQQLLTTVKTWLNTYFAETVDGKTVIPDKVSFEDLPENDTGICFSTVQAPLYAARYITGGYKGQYQFQIIYRVLPSDDGDMIDAVDFLMRFAEWCGSNPPTITNAVNIRVEKTSNAAILTAYEDGANDYGISLTLTWEEL